MKRPLAAEHAPHGPTEEHLVEQLEGLASAVGDTVRMAPAHLDATNPSERVIDAIRATASDKTGTIRWSKTHLLPVGALYLPRFRATRSAPDRSPPRRTFAIQDDESRHNAPSSS
jgi:hypothetical protein